MCSPVALRDDEAEQGPQECLDNCREQYLAVVTPRWQAAFGDVCTSLSMEGPNEQLWPLYWCDSTFCGVWVNETGPTGQDRESTCHRRAKPRPILTWPGNSKCRSDHQRVPKVRRSLLEGGCA